MNATPGYVVLDESNFHILKTVADLRRNLIGKLASFGRCKEIKDSIFEYDDAFSGTQSDDGTRFDFLYAGTHIRLTLVVGLKDKSAQGKVVCTHEYEFDGKPISAILGEFPLHERGNTNFVEVNGKPYFTNEAADLIVAHYLEKAFERNLAIEQTYPGL